MGRLRSAKFKKVIKNSKIYSVVVKTYDGIRDATTGIELLIIMLQRLGKEDAMRKIINHRPFLLISERKNKFIYSEEAGTIAKVFDDGYFELFDCAPSCEHMLSYKKKTNRVYVQPTYVAEYTDAYVIGDYEGIIINEMLLDDCIGIDDMYVEKHILPQLHYTFRDNASSCLKFRKCVNVDKGISLLKKWDSNYYHFTFEVLSRLYYIDAIPKYNDWPILIDMCVYEDKKYMDLLRIVNKKNRPIIPIRSRDLCLLHCVVVPSRNSWNINETKIIHNDYKMLQRLKKDVLGPNGIQQSNERFPSKVFVIRGNDNRLANESKLIPILKNHGYMIFNPDNASLEQEILVFANADIIVSTHGAGFANMIYCKDTVHIVEMCSYKWHKMSYFDLAHCLGYDYHWAVGVPIAPDNTSVFTVDESYLLGLLNAIEASI